MTIIFPPFASVGKADLSLRRGDLQPPDKPEPRGKVIGPQLVRFSGSDQPLKTKVLWFTPEGFAQQAGGLSDVSQDAPRELNELLQTQSIAVVTPKLLQTDAIAQQTDADKKPFEYAGVTLRLRDPFDPRKTDPVAVYQKIVKKPGYAQGIPVYALHSKYFSDFNNIYFKDPKEIDRILAHHDSGVRNNPENRNYAKEIVMLHFANASAYLSPLVGEPLSKSEERALEGKVEWHDKGKLHRLGPISTTISNDWGTAPTWLALKHRFPERYEAMSRGYYFHNEISAYIPLHVLKRAMDLEDAPIMWSPREMQKGAGPMCVALESGLGELRPNSGDFYFMDSNYHKSVMQRERYDNALFHRGRQRSMHHGVAPYFTPVENPYLRKLPEDPEDYGFASLNPKALDPKESLEERLKWMDEYKRANRVAGQKYLGLDVDPDAEPYIWVGRADFGQKGLEMVLENAEHILRKNPKAQLIFLCGPVDEKAKPFVDFMKQRYKGRVAIRETFSSHLTVVRALAASKWFMIPSIYEPFGIAQLQAMVLGTPPIATPVDGLKSTITDRSFHPIESVSEKDQYGRTGIFLRPFDPEIFQVIDYQQTIFDKKPGYRFDPSPNRAPLPENIRYTTACFKEAVNKSFRLPDEAVYEMGLNAIRYVREMHDWKRIVRQFYLPALANAENAAIVRRQKTASGEKLKATA